MITIEQYEKLLPFRNNVFAGDCPINVATQLHDIYISIGNPPANLWCKSCAGDMLAKLKLYILEYEGKI